MTSSVDARPARPMPRLDPRYLIAFLITLVLVAAQFRFHMVGGYERLAVALGTCVAAEALLSWFIRGKVVSPLSAYISGISLTLLTKPQGAVLWPFAVGGFLAIASKYVLQYRGSHLWNPTNFAICALLLAAPNRIAVLSHQWGNDVTTLVVIWGFGLVIASRVKVLHITLAYIVSFLALSALRAFALHEPLLPEIAPLTGPMYQLFIFFMITDPRTVVSERQMADSRRGAHRPRRGRAARGVGSQRPAAHRRRRRPGALRALGGRAGREVDRRPVARRSRYADGASPRSSGSRSMRRARSSPKSACRSTSVSRSTG